MKLADLIRALSGIICEISCHDDPAITSVTNNTEKVVPGALFCAIKGAKFDGHEYLTQAVDAGAAALVISRDWQGTTPENIAVIRVNDSYLAWGILCAEAQKRPAEHLGLLAVTGTNGKTSTAILTHHFLTSCGRKCGLLTTVFNDVCDGTRTPAVNTMPDAAALQALFKQQQQNGAEFVAMECSSHGLAQSRSGNAKYACAIFTNLTGDHLDYHGTMEAYYQAKKKLFTDFAAPDQTAIINVDDEYGKRLYDELAGRKRVSISFKEKTADCFVSNVVMSANGTTFDMTLDGRIYGLKIRLTGLHNVCNLVCALLAARSTGLALEDLIRAAETAPPAPGRLESFQLPNGAHAFVDYAHTDDALLRVTAALNTLKTENGRLITVFGCGGDRDRTKRPRMGRAATGNSDHTIVTSDNPRTEDPLQIIADILPGIPEGAPYEVEPDRAKAIAKALAMTEKDDMVLIAGKGHEDYQDIMGVKHHFDDREEVQKFIAQHH